MFGGKKVNQGQWAASKCVQYSTTEGFQFVEAWKKSTDYKKTFHCSFREQIAAMLFFQTVCNHLIFKFLRWDWAGVAFEWLFASSQIHIIANFAPAPYPLVHCWSPWGEISSGQNWGKKFVIPWLWSSRRPGPTVDRCFDIFIICSRPSKVNTGDDICKVDAPTKIQRQWKI